MRTIRFFLLLTLTLVVLYACHTPPDEKYTKDGKPYGAVKGLFRERWWNFYERGLSFSDGEYWNEAIADFKEAIRQRDKDQRRARTYGMHFVDYFPHRDLGVAYFHLGDNDNALKEIENSLASVDSGKAKFYLNKVRKAILESSKADTAPPTVILTSLPEEQVSNSMKLKVIGEVTDDAYAEKVSINEEPVFIELAEKKIPFSQEIKLKEGLNEISIKSSDLLGKVTEKKIKVIGDFEGPVINIGNRTEGEEVGENKVVLNGALADTTGISTFKINDQVIAYRKEREVTFACNVDLNKGENKILLAATDIAGNTTTGSLNLVYVPKLAERKRPSLHALRKKGPILLAMQGSGMLDTGQSRFLAAAMPEQIGANFRLSLKDLTETQTVYYETIYIDGSVCGVNDIKSIKLNGAPLFIIPGKTIYFNQVVDLKQGSNKLALEVEDTKGNKASKTVTIIREVPKVHEVGSRMAIAILPFDVKGEVSSASTVVYDNLLNAFLDQGRFNIVSRGPELEAALRELKLSGTDLVNKDNAVKVGKLIAAEGILMGSVRETKTSIEIYARLVNCETSAFFDAKDVYGQDKSLAQLQYLTNGLALKFKQSFPLLEGMVVKVQGRDIYADFGSLQNIKKDMKFIVFRLGEPIVHPVTGKVLGTDSQELGVATVVKVLEDLSTGKLLADFDASRIKQKDLVITK